MSDDVRFLLQIGAPFMSAVLVALLSNRAHRKSRLQMDEIHRIVMNGKALKKWEADHR